MEIMESVKEERGKGDWRTYGPQRTPKHTGRVGSVHFGVKRLKPF